MERAAGTWLRAPDAREAHPRTRRAPPPAQRFGAVGGPPGRPRARGAHRRGPDEWGPRGWNWLHVTAINYAHDPSAAEMRRTRDRVWGFIGSLPCAECRGHAVEYATRNPPDLSDTFALQAWVWRFHNAVNLRLGKRAFTYEEYLGFYADELLWADGGGTD